MPSAQECAGRVDAAGSGASSRLARRSPLGWVGLLAAMLLTAACSRSPDEEALREAMAEMVAAAEARRPDDFMQHVAEDFAAAKGLDRKALHRMLLAQFLRNQSVGVTTGPLTVAIDQARAEVRFTAFVTGSAAGWIPERAEGYQIKTLWRFEDGAWLLEWADWE